LRKIEADRVAEIKRVEDLRKAKIRHAQRVVSFQSSFVSMVFRHLYCLILFFRLQESRLKRSVKHVYVKCFKRFVEFSL
jgi:hypothetical protein